MRVKRGSVAKEAHDDGMHSRGDAFNIKFRRARRGGGGGGCIRRRGMHPQLHRCTTDTAHVWTTRDWSAVSPPRPIKARRDEYLPVPPSASATSATLQPNGNLVPLFSSTPPR